MAIHVHFLPQWARVDDFIGQTVVVIDILRATTTITQALAAGAPIVIPCLEVDEARQMAATINGPIALGGERGSRLIPGFHFGNSPAEYTPASVGGKTVIFTTTNGTRAMQHCRKATRLLLGAFTNLSALIRELAAVREFALVCAGTDGQVTREDVLFAGAVLDRWLNQHGAGDSPTSTAELSRDWNDEALLALAAWRDLRREGEERLERQLAQSRGGRNLTALGMAADIGLAARVDSTDVVGELDTAEWRVTVRRC